MTITYKNKNLESIKADATIVVLEKKANFKKVLSSDEYKLLEEVGFLNEDTESFYLPHVRKLFVKVDSIGVEDIKTAASNSYKTLKKYNLKSVKTEVAGGDDLSFASAFCEGIILGSYEFDWYKSKEKKVTERYVKELATKTPSTDQLVVNLSGGNQQKVVIAKWLTRDSEILIFDEPTRGIDVGAKNEIYKLMNQLAAEGKAIIMISSEMTEILRMSDRIVVMCEGKKTGELDISEATQENIMNMATREIE